MSGGYPFHLFNTTQIDAVSMGGNITSSAINVQEAISYSVQAVWSGGGTPVGTFDLQGSNDGTNFTSVLSATVAVSGNSGNLLINVEKHAYAYIRLVYTRTSGTATMTAIVNGKQG